MTKDNFNLVDFFNAFRNRKTYDEYTQDSKFAKTDRTKWAGADANNDGTLDIDDAQLLEERYNTISKSKTVYDVTQDDEVKFDDLFAFSESMDVNGDGRTCGLEKEFLQGRTRLVYAQVKENLEKNEEFKLADLMDYSKAVSDLDAGKKNSLTNEIATLESTMIDKLRTKYGSDYDIDGKGAKGDLNDLKSFWETTAGANQLNLGHESKLMEFLEETETGLRRNVKTSDQNMTDQKLDTMKSEIQTKVLADSTEETSSASGTKSCGRGSTGSTSSSSGTSGTTATSTSSTKSYAGTFSYEVRDYASSLRFIADKLGFSEEDIQSVQYDSEGRVQFFEKKCGFTCRHNQKENYTLCYDCERCEITVVHDNNGEKDTSVYKYQKPPTPTACPTVCPTTCPTTCPTNPPTTCPTNPPTTCPTNPPTTCPTDPPTTCPTNPPTTCPCPTDPPTSAPTCAPEPRPHGRPEKPSRVDNINNGIIDGPGNDIYGMGNRGIIDTQGDDIYTRNYTVNTYNITNNYINDTPTVPPSDPPTVPPTDPPTVPPTDPPTVPPTDPPTVPPTDPPTVPPTDPPTVPPTDPPTPPGPERPDTIDLLPLRNVLNVMEGVAGGQRDGVLSDFEMDKSMKHANIVDMDGDKKNISDEEMAILNRIKAFNEDKDLISDVIAGDYSNISDETLAELQDLSDTIKELTKRRE